MSFPASLTTRELKGRFVTHPDGVGAKGSVRIVLTKPMHSETDNTVVAPFDTTIVLSENGEFSTTLPATNDPQWTPSSYRVTITIETTHQDPHSWVDTRKTAIIRYTLTVPYDSTDPIDLGDAVQLNTP